MKLVCESLNESMFENRKRNLEIALEDMFYDWKNLKYIQGLRTYSESTGISYSILLILKKMKILIPLRDEARRDSTYKWNESDPPNFSLIAQKVLNKYAAQQKEKENRKFNPRIYHPQARSKNSNRMGSLEDYLYHSPILKLNNS